jgi:uncharacterized protein (TIGR02145 family)
MKDNNLRRSLTSMILPLILLIISPWAFAQQKSGFVTDIDGNIYKTIIIGDQVWMAENLRTTKFNDGTSIGNETDMTKWVQITIPAYAWCNNDIANKKTYGALYNWYAVNTGNLCPAGWRVPSDAEWTILTDFLGGTETSGGKLKETGTSHWNSPNSGATNETGFSAVPAGYRYGYFWGQGTFYEMGINCYYWSASECTNTHIWSRTINAGNSKVYRSIFVKNEGFSVRCIKGS